jgi:glycosylphosphatidylinositol transamidase (GPIT) subunit GPI8
LAKRENVQRVSLLVDDSKYGATFFDWFGFFATELGMEVTAVVKAKLDPVLCSTYSDKVAEGRPEMIFVVPSDAAQGTCIARHLRQSQSKVRLVYSDTGMTPYYISQLGELAEGLEGVSYSYDPQSGFAVAYRVLFDAEPPAYSGNLYDSMMILAFALELSNGKGGADLAAAIRQVVDGRGEKTGWDSYEIARTLRLLRTGASPDIMGATGALEFDKVNYTDPLSSNYAHWRIEDGKYVVTEHFTTAADSPFRRRQNSDAAYQTYASEQRLQLFSGGLAPDVKQRTGNYALVVSTSDSWANYRHQADALAQYDLLRKNGFSDEHIILIVADDIAANGLNPEPGSLYNEVGGSDLYGAAQIDYRAGELDTRALLDILGGRPTAERPNVLVGSDTDNVYVFLVGHGDSRGLCLKDCAEHLSPTDLQQAIDEMSAAGRFRRMLVVVEACHGGVMGTGLSTPGVLLLTGANAVENSLATNYDQRLNAWLSDEFAFAYYSTLRTQPKLHLYDLYRETYLAVPGSHVTLFNAGNFGDLSQIDVSEFLNPVPE